ncbi:hypothetical protein H0H81_004660, partial [Sphagnurus paluster]
HRRSLPHHYGPPSSSLQANIIAWWRKHFIVEEHMLKLDMTVVTPAPVFDTSRHVARLTDWILKDTVTCSARTNSLELGGILEAQGMEKVLTAVDEKKRKETTAKTVVVKVVKEYETVLARRYVYMTCSKATAWADP